MSSVEPILIFETLHGSRAFGLALPLSDVEKKGVVVGPRRWYFERKRCAEHLELTEAEKRALAGRWDQLEALLDGALARTSLPEEPPNSAAVESWLIQQRIGRLG